jgi:hypothetical protein
LSIVERKDFVSELSSELKSELWGIQFDNYLSENSNLSDDQIQIINEFRSILSPKFFEYPLHSPEWDENVDKPLKALTKRMYELFPKETVRSLILVLGKDDNSLISYYQKTDQILGIKDSTCPNVETNTNSKSVRFKFASYKKTKTPGDCVCNTQHFNECYYPFNCGYSGPCLVRPGCGTLGRYPCNGTCVFGGES